VTRPRNTESDRERASDEGLVGVLIRFAYVSSDVAAGTVARRDVKRKWFVKLSRVELNQVTHTPHRLKNLLYINVAHGNRARMVSSWPSLVESISKTPPLS
jgi:thioester reductase-like protein